MRKLNALLFLLTLPALSCIQSQQTSEQGSLAIKDVTIIDATGSPPQLHMTVLMTNDRITAVGSTREISIPKSAQMVDGTGKFLVPGLWDMHVHTRRTGIDFFPLFIANGITGVRDMNAPLEHLEKINRWRRQISEGTLLGPHIFSAGPALDGPTPNWPRLLPQWDGTLILESSAQAQETVASLKSKKVDFLKIKNLLPRETYLAILSAGEKEGLPSAGHVPYFISAAEASDAGQKSISHLDGILLACSAREEELREKLLNQGEEPEFAVLLDTYSEDKAAFLFARFAKNDTWQGPTLTSPIAKHGSPINDWIRLQVVEEVTDLNLDPRLKYIPRSIREEWTRHFHPKPSERDVALYQRLLQRHLDLVGAMHRAGVKFISGSDGVKAYNYPGFALHEELVLMVRSGLTPMEALQTATRNAAEFLGLLDSLGTVEANKIADLVLLEANPLEDIRNTRKIASVVVQGRLIDQPSIEKMLAEVEAAADLM